MGKSPYVTSKGAGLDTVKIVGRTKTGAVSKSTDSIIDRTGELNAYNKKDLLSVISQLLDMAQKGEVVKKSRMQDVEKQAEKAEFLRHAFHDRTGQDFAILGEAVADEIWTTVRREGFIRRVLMERPAGPGEVVRIRIKRNDVVGLVMASDGNTVVSNIKQRVQFPPDFYINALIKISEKELAQSPVDLLDEKQEDGRESIQVQEDRSLRKILIRAASIHSTPTYFSTFNPQVFTTMKNKIQNRGVPVTNCVLAGDLWNDIITDDEFNNWFDPVSKHELILTGELGSLLNVTLISDTFLESQLRILQAGEVFFCAAPKTLGQFITRKNLVAEPVNFYPMGEPSRGWFLNSIVAVGIGNGLGVTYGKRL